MRVQIKKLSTSHNKQFMLLSLTSVGCISPFFFSVSLTKKGFDEAKSVGSLPSLVSEESNSHQRALSTSSHMATKLRIVHLSCQLVIANQKSARLNLWISKNSLFTSQVSFRSSGGVYLWRRSLTSATAFFWHCTRLFWCLNLFCFLSAYRV